MNETIPATPPPDSPSSSQPGRRITSRALAAGVALALSVAASAAVAATAFPELPARIGLGISRDGVLPRLSLLTGAITIETEPAGALARLDGQEVGLTPLSLDRLAPGRHRLSLSAADHEEWTGEIVVPAKGQLLQRITLRGLPARLALSTAILGAHLWTDGSPRGELPTEVQLPPGEWLLRVEADGYVAWEQLVRFRANELRRWHLATAGSQLALVPGDPGGSLAVVIDNYPLARPQVGLDRADVVYEALVEGGITRLLAVFLTHEADVVGPVRSARHYFVHWATEYAAPLVHIGSSPQGYGALASTGTPSIDGRVTWRDGNRPAPHNAFTSTGTAQGGVSRRAPGSFGGLHFQIDPGTPEGAPATEVAIAYNRSYRVSWTYDSEARGHQRSVNGAAHVDGETGDALLATNVLILWMNSWPIEDGSGRLDLGLTGKGRLLALVDGIAIEGQWTRPSLRSVTEYRDGQGNSLPLNPGLTWVQVVPPSVQIEVTGEIL